MGWRGLLWGNSEAQNCLKGFYFKMSCGHCKQVSTCFPDVKIFVCMCVICPFVCVSGKSMYTDVNLSAIRFTLFYPSLKNEHQHELFVAIILVPTMRWVHVLFLFFVHATSKIQLTLHIQKMLDIVCSHRCYTIVHTSPTGPNEDFHDGHDGIGSRDGTPSEVSPPLSCPPIIETICIHVTGIARMM